MDHFEASCKSIEEFILGFIRLIRSYECQTTSEEPRKPTHVKTIQWYFKVISLTEYLHFLNKNRRGCTQRELYYTLCNIFKSQRDIQSCLQYVAKVTGMSLSHLGVRISDKGNKQANIIPETGMIAGSIEFKICDKQIDVAAKQYGVNITYNMFDFEANVKANHILVVEKYTVFMSLCSNEIWKKLPMILITGCGFPSHNTRKLAENLSSEHGIEVSYLGDYDPHGFLIFLSYVKTLESTVNDRFKSNLSTKNNKYRWIGMRAKDVKEYGIKRVVNLTSRESKIIENLLSDPRILGNALLKHEIEEQRIIQKAEIEALEEATSTGGLSEYIIKKILSRDWIEA